MPDAAVCPTHPTEPVMGSCARCGTFFCRLDSRLLDGKLYCATCAARGDVDWLEGFKLQRWGKRDGWAWLFGISAPLPLAGGIMMLTDAETRLLAPFVLAAAVGGALWWLRVAAARWLLVAVLLAEAVFVAVTVHPLSLLGNLIPLLILYAVAVSTSTKLFFKLEVGRDELRQMWNLHANNQVARHALSLGLVGLVIWPFAPFAVLLGAIGLTRVDLDARPPIGRKGSAIAGIVLGIAGAVIGTAVVILGIVR